MGGGSGRTVGGTAGEVDEVAAAEVVVRRREASRMSPAIDFGWPAEGGGGSGLAGGERGGSGAVEPDQVG